MVTRSINDHAGITESLVERDASVMTDGLTLFNISGGPILLTYIGAECITANDATASTFRLGSDGTAPVGSGTFTAVSGSVASANIGSTVIATSLTSIGGTLAYTANTTSFVSTATSGALYLPIGTIYITVGVGSTTGTWKWRLLYKKLTPQSLVSAA